MEIVIAKSKKTDKKFDAVIDGKKQSVLVSKELQITLNIKIHKGKKLIYHDIKK